jgi:predicted dehydrogenase
LIVFDAKGHEGLIPATSGDQRRFYAGVRNAILGRGSNPVTPIEALAVMAVIEAGTTSARKQAAVALSLTDEEISQWRSVDHREQRSA